MTRNPFLNALAAMVYIVIVASVMYYGPRFAEEAEGVVVPVAMISLFTLSAAIMGYAFLYQPIRMYLDGEKQAAAALFLKTLGVFAGITVLFFLGLFLSTL